MTFDCFVSSAAMKGPLALKANSSICPGVSTMSTSGFKSSASLAIVSIWSAIRSAAIINAPLGPSSYFSMMSSMRIVSRMSMSGV